jgi:hypothetical protein
MATLPPVMTTFFENEQNAQPRMRGGDALCAEQVSPTPGVGEQLMDVDATQPQPAGGQLLAGDKQPCTAPEAAAQTDAAAQQPADETTNAPPGAVPATQQVCAHSGLRLGCVCLLPAASVPNPVLVCSAALTHPMCCVCH